MPQHSDSNNINVSKLEQQLGSLLAERNDILAKKQNTQDSESRQWYSVRLRHIDALIHKTRNALFIEKNAL